MSAPATFMILCNLSAMAPDTIVVAVVAKDSWNRKVTKVEPCSAPEESTNLGEVNWGYPIES